MTELAGQIASNANIPADVKASFDQLSKDLAAMMPKFVQPGGGRGGGGGGGGRGAGAGDNVMALAAQAKNGMMGGMWPGEQTTKAIQLLNSRRPPSAPTVFAQRT